MKVLIAHKHPDLEGMLDHQSEIEYVSAKRDRNVIAQEIPDANVFIADKQVPPTQEELESAENLRLIHTGTGYKFLNKETKGIDYATEHGIAVANTPGVVAQDVAEHTFDLIHDVNNLGLGAAMDEETFGKGKGRMRLGGKTFGSIGYGNIGSIACRIARGYGMDVLVVRKDLSKQGEYDYDSNVRLVDFDQLLSDSDIVSIHVPETEETTGMIGDEQFQQMKDTAWLINTARGKIVDETALVRALDQGEIARAGIDVYSKEPLYEKPELNREFMRLVEGGKMVCTPHIASNSIEGEYDRAIFYLHNIIMVNVGGLLDGVVNGLDDIFQY